jgi:hypothetical protein
MAAGPLTRIARISVLLLAIPAFGGSSVASPCFDLNQPNVTLLQPPPATFPEIGKESESFGKNEKTGFDWAIASGRVNKPLSFILEKLLDPMTTRDREITEVEMSRIEVKGAIQKQHLKIKVKPIFFLTLDWEEDWLYTIKKGKPGKMESVVISYQKTSGTSHIEHFCGNILIQRIKPGISGVFLTEEIKADRRSAEDVYRGLMGTLRILRQ